MMHSAPGDTLVEASSNSRQHEQHRPRSSARTGISQSAQIILSEGEEQNEEQSTVIDRDSELLNVQKVYASSPIFQRRSSARSVSSFTSTVWSSTSTTQVSNTTQQQQQKKQKKRRFLVFTRILMRLLEKKNPAVFHEARAVIQDCEERKKKGETESVVECLKYPLRETVGPDYWNEARSYSDAVLHSHPHHNDKQPTKDDDDDDEEEEELQPLPHTAVDGDFSFSPADVSFLHKSLVGYSSPTSKSKHSTTADKMEQKVRKKRMWMIICVLMKYLMTKDTQLYLRAKGLICECVSRHKMGQVTSLSGSIQSMLKGDTLIGPLYWKRAEHSVAKMLLAQQESSQLKYNQQNYCITTGNTKTPIKQDQSLKRRLHQANMLNSRRKRHRCA